MLNCSVFHCTTVKILSKPLSHFRGKEVYLLLSDTKPHFLSDYNPFSYRTIWMHTNHRLREISYCQLKPTGSFSPKESMVNILTFRKATRTHNLHKFPKAPKQSSFKLLLILKQQKEAMFTCFVCLFAPKQHQINFK